MLQKAQHLRADHFGKTGCWWASSCDDDDDDDDDDDVIVCIHSDVSKSWDSHTLKPQAESMHLFSACLDSQHLSNIAALLT